jgi:hypothetical protein
MKRQQRFLVPEPLVLLLRDYLDVVGPVHGMLPLFCREDNRPMSASDICDIVHRR